MAPEVAKLPYFKWYPADAEADEKYSLMTDAELGFYHRCLNRAWTNDGLPEDLDQLARLLNHPVATIRKLWVKVGQCFELVDSRYRNRRQEAERTKARTKSESATKSVRTRYERSTPVATNVLPRAYDCDYSSSEGVKGEPQFLDPNGGLSTLVDRLCSLHRKKGDRSLVETTLVSIISPLPDGEQSARAELIEARHKMWCESEWNECDTRFVKRLSTWLIDGGWRDEPNGEPTDPHAGAPMWHPGDPLD